ncbi:MAG: hypothetical protein WBX25_22890 [Rhodomicrobium sp.]
MKLRSFCLALALLTAPLAAAQEAADNNISDETLKALETLAWQSLPTKIIIGGKKILEIDKSDPAKIIIPDADAWDVVSSAQLTARAQRCDLKDLVIANRDAFLLRMKRTGKWSDSQLQFINALHLFTVQLLVGRTSPAVADKQLGQPDSDAEDAPGTENGKGCSEKEKQDITSAVEANEKLLEKSSLRLKFGAQD